MRDDGERLLDILEAASRIEKYTAAGRERFDSDELVQNWVVHHLEVIGEACARVSEDLRSRHPEIPWRGYAAMRNILIHQYFGIDLEPVWLAATAELADLRTRIAKILDDESKEDEDS